MQGTNWVKVSERRPRGGEQVMVVDMDGFMHLATYQYNSFQIIIKQDGELIETVARFVTHWVPLPPMPEGEDNKIDDDYMSDHQCDSEY